MKRSMGPKTILCPTPVLVVGTYDAQGRANATTAAWGGICCSKPPCIAVSFRAATLAHANITTKGAFTVSVPAVRHLRAADHFGVVSGHDVDKFAATGLTAQRSEVVDAPYVAEFPLVLECRVAHVNELGLHTQFVGEIIDVKLDEECLDEGGQLDAGRLDAFFYVPQDGHYYGGASRIGKAFSVGRTLEEADS